MDHLSRLTVLHVDIFTCGLIQKINFSFKNQPLKLTLYLHVCICIKGTRLHLIGPCIYIVHWIKSHTCLVRESFLMMRLDMQNNRNVFLVPLGQLYLCKCIVRL